MIVQTYYERGYAKRSVHVYAHYREVPSVLVLIR